MEGEFTTRDGTKLYTKAWKPDCEPAAVPAILIFLHGFSDHINAYYDFFPTLSSPSFNIAVYAYDQRGWGRSVRKPAEKGLTGPTKLVLSDLDDFVGHVLSLAENQGKPLFLMGHSMGGGEALCYMLSTSSELSNRSAISGLLLEAPYIELDPAEQPGFMKVSAGKLAAMLLPHMQLKQKLSATFMSRSAKVRQDWVDDALCHDTGTLEGLKDLLQRSADLSLLSRGIKVDGFTTNIPCPVWFSFGSGDRVLSMGAAQRLYNVLQAPNRDKAFQSYPDAYHKLHAEPDGVGEQFAKDVASWILAHKDKVDQGQGVTVPVSQERPQGS